MTPRVLLPVFAATVLFGATGSGWNYHKSRAPLLPGIPTHDYQWGSTSRTETRLSMPAVEIKLEQRAPYEPGLPPAGIQVQPSIVLREKLRYYQLLRPRMQIDHCFLSQFSLVLHEDGAWTLSLRADQNPWAEGQVGNLVSALGSIPPGIAKETMELKRNQFFVRIRCYGAFPLPEGLPRLHPAKPVLIDLAPAPFWVQRGQPYNLFTKQYNSEISKYFDLIDRVGVEFYYR